MIVDNVTVEINNKREGDCLKLRLKTIIDLLTAILFSFFATVRISSSVLRSSIG